MAAGVVSVGGSPSLLAPPRADTHPLRLFRLGALNVVLGEVAILLGWTVFPLLPAIAAPEGFGPFGPLLCGTAIWALAALACVDLLRSERLISGVGVITAAALLGGPTAAAWVAFLGTLDARELRGRVTWREVLADHGLAAWAAFATGALMLWVRALPGHVSQLLDLGVMLGGALVYAALTQGMAALMHHARSGVRPADAFGHVRRLDWNLWLLAESAVAFLAALTFWQGAGWAPVVVVGVDAVVAFQMRHQRSTWDLRHHPITALPNALGLKEHAGQLARPGRSPEPAFLLYLDLDRFKDINDTFGHDAGDEVLRAIGAGLATVSRPEVFVAHLHGDEFAVLLMGFRGADVQRLAVEIRELVGRSVPSAYALEPPVSATVGQAPVGDLRDLTAAMAVADREMLAAKERRRIAEGRERRGG